jgi:capsular polysaccharide biosynthesis protein
MSDILTESYSKEITESLNNLIKEKNSRNLALRLSLSENESQLISKIDVESVKKDKQDEKKGDIFIVTADIHDRNILPKLQVGILSFLRNNEFVKIRVEQKKKYFVSMIDKIESEIKSLDSLKKKLFLGQPIYSKTSEMMLVDPTNIYSKIVELTRQQWEYKNNLELVDSIQLVEGFTVFEKPASPKLSVLLAIGFFGGFFVAISILTLKHLFKLANSQPS